MADQEDFKSYPGSWWHRWDPHLHAPGTVLNDQFKGSDRWERYLSSLESSLPTIRALGVTDYCVVDSYEHVLEYKRGGRLAKCDLIFPNIELRLAVGTVQRRWVNIHLLVSPEDPKHIAEAKRFLARLEFRAHDEVYSCTREDLSRLGQRVDQTITDSKLALAKGVEQFKVTFDNLREVYDQSGWAKANILVAVAGSETDGTSGVRAGADVTLRREMEKFAHIIFASSSAQREFWLGERSVNIEKLRADYGGTKPCLHGSDAHDQSAVGTPAENRFSWIKGAATFDSLRQACIDPASRAFVGARPPMSAPPSQVISSINVEDAEWALTPQIDFNPGLVAIIGARGSGKTALADIIACGCDATLDRLSDASFLKRAHHLLGQSSVSLRWQEDEHVDRRLDGSSSWEASETPRARYLSQKFVEDLCSASGITDELLREIERVIFESHFLSDRDGTFDFEELRELRTRRFRDAREREEENLADISDRIGTEMDKWKLVDGLKKQVDEKSKIITGYTKDRSKLIAKGSEARVSRLAALNAAADKVRVNLRSIAQREQSLLSMQDEVKSFRTFGAVETLRKMSERHRLSGLRNEQWNDFLLDYVGNVDTALDRHLTTARSNGAAWRGTQVQQPDSPNTPLFGDDIDIERIPLGLLEAEIRRLETLVSADRDIGRRYSTLSQRINEEAAALESLKQRLADCEAAKDRLNTLVMERAAAYVRVFEAVVGEENVLHTLYGPLERRLAETGGTLSKMTFSVSREVDTGRWADFGEDLLDLRKISSFKGKGTLQQLAEALLGEAWKSGDPQAVGDAMSGFRYKYDDSFLEGALYPKTDQTKYREWTKRFARWLYSTDHININYGIHYDGIDIQNLSPGTRGIVLLLLYLALDDVDDRPLIIDQPEENLDPKSIFDELVDLFVKAKSKRQVIMVTHNANLVVNADADQIIIAEVGSHTPGKLPPIRYTSGGLEESSIRKLVCDILEGGERAFQERARRLRVKLDR
jgi:energy-coupling factor transporter ATP-binding protein EcfA2